MATVWERIQQAAKAAYAAWQAPAQVPDLPPVPGYVASLEATDAERVEKYALLWKYYRGEHKRHLRVRMTPSGPGPDDNVTINLSRRVVNKGVDFLFGKPLRWQLDESGETPAERALDDVWGNDERRMAFFAELATNGGVCGDFYLQIVPPAERGQPARLVNINPAIIFPKTDPSDIAQEWAFELRWFRGETLCRTVHARQEGGDFWETWDEQLVRGRWERLTEPAVWPFAWPMFVHGKNLPNPNQYFGASDLEDADINDAINMVASNINRITRIFAHPLVWGRGFGRDSVSVDASQMFLSQEEYAEMGALELGRNLASSQDYLQFLRTSFSEITGVPQSDPDRLTIGAQSGFALKVLFNDLVLKTGTKRATYGGALIEANRRVLELMGMGDANNVTLHWQDPLPVDERETNDGDRFELEAGLVSKETVATERGRDWETEQTRMQADKVADGNVGDMLLRSFERGAMTQ